MRDDARDKLASSAISVSEAADAGMHAVSDASLVHKSFAAVPALVLPYYAPDGSKMTYGPHKEPFVRVRYLAEVHARTRRGEPKKLVRYAQPPASGIKAYFPWVGDPAGPSAWEDVLNDVGMAIVITEGELKATCSSLCGAPTIGLGGVYNFTGPDGKLLPELAAINWRGRTVYIAFDSDAVNNPQVAVAEARLIETLMHEGARPALVRIPEADDGSKQGIDDFVVNNDARAWMSTLETTPTLNAVEKGVLAMNEHVAWVEKDAKAIDLRTHTLVSPQSMTTGSRFAAMRVPTLDADGNPKLVQTAKIWLTHPYAQRYDDILFRPGQGPVVQEDGGRALNLWRGLTHELGDVGPFLELSEFLFSKLHTAEVAELPLKWLAYKAQNPGLKIPLALVLIGQQGCGKSLWCEILRDAFTPYGTELRSSDLLSENQGWLEKSLFVAVNEAKGKDMFLGAERLRSLVSDEVQYMTEKWRVARNVKCYASFVITSNNRAAGSFAGDDRRNIVVNCPNKRDKAFYMKIRAWKDAGGPAHVMDYLLAMGLKGWTPPVEAPVTAEKRMAYYEGLTPVQVVAAKALESDSSLVVEWLDASFQWAVEAETSGDVRAARIAEEIKRSVKSFQIRPWYTSEELALVFPAITRDLFGNRRVYSTVAGHISRELRDAGLTYLECRDNVQGFKWRGQYHQFLIVAEHNDWQEPITQADFERLMKSWPTYGEYRAKIPRIQEVRERWEREGRPR